jgi:sulfhydrogenase subunit alpha
MAGPHSTLVERGLRLKKIGNRILAVLGGRAIHPVSVCVGGFHRVPRPNELLDLAADLEWAAAAAEETVRWTMQLTFPDFHPASNFVSLSGPAEYPMNAGRIVSSSGLDLPVSKYDENFVEHYVPHSTALHSLLAGQPYVVGPLARLNFNRDLLMPRARRLADSWPVTWPISNPYMSIVARALELLHACEEALVLVSSYKPPAEPKVRFRAVAGEGCAATEAPRGLLFHRYTITQRGLVDFARIVAPTSQNLRSIEEDLRLRIAPLAERPDSDIMAASQELVRCYDPCLSCSTHMLRFSVRRH